MKWRDAVVGKVAGSLRVPIEGLGIKSILESSIKRVVENRGKT